MSHRKYTDEQIQKIRAMRKDGCSTKDIQERFGGSKNAVNEIFRRDARKAALEAKE